MISTVSLSFDLSASPPRAVVTDSTTYPFAVDLFGAKGYGVFTFNGDIIEEKDTVSDPLINLEAFETTAFINLPLDNNGNVANGVYGFQYSLRIDSGGTGAGYVGTVTGNTTFTSGAEWLVEVLPVGSSIFINDVANTVAAAQVNVSNAVITLSIPTANGPGTVLSFNNNVSLQFSGTYAYSGCTQTTADVSFTYDCEYEDFGTWAVSNATVLGSNEIIASESCTINYPSWTNIDPIFNPQIVTTSLPYPTLPTEDTPLATGTYSVLLSQQIQQTQTSGLIVLYSNSITKEFTVSCAGTLCGLVPCIENLRAAHATELVRNRISKYQVFVDNVLLYYTEAMNYRACGELDKYKSTIALLQAQLDASGCDCACCDNETYYWVSNNSANSIIDELIANFQYRLFDGGIVDPGPTQAGVQYGAIWQNTNTGVLYRCIDATPSNLEWILYYDPSIVYPTGADNGLSISSGNVVLGGSLDNDTTIDLNSQDLTFSDGNFLFSGTGSQKVTLSSLGNVLQVTGGVGALSVDGTTNALDLTSTTNTAARVTVNTTTNNAAATNLSLRTTVDGGSGDDGVGSSIQFATESSTNIPVTTASIESVLVSATSPVQANLNFKTRSSSSSRLLDRLTLNSDGSSTFSVIRGTTDNTVSKNIILRTVTDPLGSAVVGNGFGASMEFVLENTTGGFPTTSSIKSSWISALAQSSKLDITTAAAGVESTQLSILSNGDLNLDKYGDGNKTGLVAYNLGVQSNGQVVESEFPVYSLIILRVTQSSGSVSVSTIVNTTKDAVTGANIGAGEFRLSHPDIVASKTSVLVQNGNAGSPAKVGLVYAEAGSGVINFTTYGIDPASLANSILNNAIVEIKIFP